MFENGQVRNRFQENGKPKKSDGEEQEEDFTKEKMSQEVLRDKLLELRHDLLSEISEQLHPDRLLEKLGVRMQARPDVTCVGNNLNKLNAINSKENVGISNKQFEPRNSVLTDLLKVTHIATIYNVFVAILISLFLSTIIHDIINTGSVNLGFQLLSWNFTSYSSAILIWIIMIAYNIALYYAYEFWAKTRARLTTSYFQSKLDNLAVTILVMFFIAHIVLPGARVRMLNFPLASAMTVVIEQIRLLMKMHAFVRTNVPRTLKHKPTSTEPYFIPTLDKYIYFLFAPTLIYKDQYPRTSHIRWKFAAARFFEVFCIVLYIAFISERYILPTMRNFGKPDVPFIYIIAMIIDNSIPAIIGVVCIFFAILHSWLNGMAEILTFADRQFYKDWWNTSAYAEYYKTWNTVVYDWLYTFIYKDLGSLFFESRLAKAVLVIAVSAAFHEYVMSVALGFFIPAFIIIYGIGGPLMMQLSSLNRTVGNVWIWFTLCLGSSIMVTMYLAEYYARINCPRTMKSDLLNFWIPRMVTCYTS